MNKLICTIILSFISFSCFSKTVKDNEISKSQNLISLFNKSCIEAFLDNDKLADFLFNNKFEILNKENNNSKNLEKKPGLDLSENGNHYFIINNDNKFFLDITEDSCSVLVKTVYQDAFNTQFKNFRKEFSTELFTEISKSLEIRKGSITYKLTSYNYYSQEDGEELPFKIYLGQTNSTNNKYQLKLTIQLNTIKEKTYSKYKLNFLENM